MKKTLLLGGILAGAVAFVPTAVAAPNGGGCQLDGNAAFTTGLGTTARDFGYSFTGTLSNCQATPGAPAVTGGTVSAGKPITINGVTYQEPQPTGNGSCASSTTSGIAFVQWNGGGLTIVKYSTSGAAAAVVLQGSVLNSVTLTGTDANGNVVTNPVASTQYVGYSSAGPLAFEPPNPTDCNSAAGVTNAGIQGFLGLGSQ